MVNIQYTDGSDSSVIHKLKELGDRSDLESHVMRCGFLMQEALIKGKLQDYYKFMSLQCQLLGYIEAAKSAAKHKPVEVDQNEIEMAKEKSREYYASLKGKVNQLPALPEPSE